VDEAILQDDFLSLIGTDGSSGSFMFTLVTSCLGRDFFQLIQKLFYFVFRSVRAVAKQVVRLAKLKKRSLLP